MPGAGNAATDLSWRDYFWPPPIEVSVSAGLVTLLLVLLVILFIIFGTG